MTPLVVLTVLEIVVLVAGLAFFLYWVGTLLTRIAGNLEESAGIAGQVVQNARVIKPAVEHINRTGGVVAGALPLLYGMAEEIVTDVTPRPEPPAERRNSSLPVVAKNSRRIRERYVRTTPAALSGTVSPHSASVIWSMEKGPLLSSTKASTERC